MADLFTSARAKQAIIGQSSFTSTENTTISSLVTAVSQAIQQRCHADFTSTAYVELRDGTGTSILQLENYPILSITRVATNPTAVIRVTNTSSSVQRATVRVTSTGLSLRHVASAVTTDNTLAFATYTTITTLAAAITALGNGWSAAAVSPYGNWPSADLAALQGAINAKNASAELKIYVEDISAYDVDDARGQLVLNSIDFTRFETDLNFVSPVWQPGIRNYRIDHTAGYSTIPEPIQEAGAQWVAALYHQAKRDPGLVQAQTVSVGSFISLVNRQQIPAHVLGLIAPYIRHSLGRR